MSSSTPSVGSGSDLVSQIVAQKQAAIQQQAALKAAALVMDVQKDSGTRLIESLIKSANATAAPTAQGSIDVLA
ncbi:MAG: hypothetical protein K2Q09_00665 [Phycisphaerales bacterium]|nr:hypothetical protein [Phycisphaerales bacterium]